MLAPETIRIIGVGISALVTAHSLSQAGRNVYVIETRDRIGGRIHTDDSSGFPYELGASFLYGAKGNPLTAITDNAGMSKRLLLIPF